MDTKFFNNGNFNLNFDIDTKLKVKTKHLVAHIQPREETIRHYSMN